MDEIEEIRPSEQYTEQFDRWQAGQDCLQMDLDGFFTDPGSGIERNDDGLCEGVDRLTCVGNAVNPFQAYPIFAAIAAIEGRTRQGKHAEKQEE